MVETFFPPFTTAEWTQTNETKIGHHKRQIFSCPAAGFLIHIGEKTTTFSTTGHLKPARLFNKIMDNLIVALIPHSPNYKSTYLT